MRILTVTSALPTPENPGSMAPLARQLESLEAAGVTVDVTEVQGLPGLKYLQTYPRMLKQLKDVDLIHAHYGYCGWLARMQVNKPVVVSFMGDDLLGTPDDDGDVTQFSKWVVKADQYLAGKVASVIVKSPEMAELVKPVKAHVVPNGVNTNVFKPIDKLEAKNKLGWDLKKRYILFPGNPENPRKGYAFATDVTKRASELLGEHLVLMPLWNVDPDDVAYYMNACDLMLMTSLLEGSPNVVKEAMACDLPVISNPVGDVDYLFENAQGYSMCEREVEPFARVSVARLQSDEEIKGREALERKGLDLASVAKRIIGIYEQVLTKTAQGDAQYA